MNKAYRDNFADIDWSVPISRPKQTQQNPKRSNLGCPMLIADHMNPVQSQLDGQMYDSKSAIRRTYKTAGVIEVGDDSSIVAPKPREKTKPDMNSIKASVGKAMSQAGLGA